VNNRFLHRNCFRGVPSTSFIWKNVPGSASTLDSVISLPQSFYPQHQVYSVAQNRFMCSSTLHGLQQTHPYANGTKFMCRYFSGTNLFTPMSAQEEEDEKLRVAQLSSEEKDRELRQLNRQIAILEKKRGINTGELYTWAGRYKALARDYGMPLVAWYWAVWVSTGIVCYGAIILFDVDVLFLLQQMDARTGWDLANQINPEYGKIGMALVANEFIEPIRLPIVIVTVKPVMDRVYPPKY
jgi:Protein of unknown function (DUF1279)